MRCILPTRRSMALNVNIMHGCDPSNKTRTDLQPKKNKAAKGIISAVHY